MKSEEREEREKIVYAIIGPTAVGKTRAGMELAGMTDSEIISVDSRQVYRYLDIGADKISPEDRRAIPHHLIDVADPDEIFTAADFVTRASSAIERIRARGKTPLLVGGTALYYRALEGAMLSESLPKDEKTRQNLEEEAKLRGTQALHKRLITVDPQAASRIHPNDKFRLMRALEIFELSGRSATDMYRESKKMSASVKIRYFGIDAPRRRLYESIERRVEDQFRSGYPEEVKWLLDNGYPRSLPALQGFGYRELVLYLDGLMTFDEAMRGDVKSTKAFARRQLTWFKHFYPIIWFDLSDKSLENTAKDMKKIISEGVYESKAESGDR
ncbi:MAG: tRNA (adenosine(37)-N6)-dimethylallyltransferase MiaA [Synergistaceae bacterium]|jgi:tRNA dimethylallyltransferase|nr:tRNA (adenosine(37)-N6)-dimethylallyltransferase MiaA [Synergistaceae bacterium]